jgi:hypothetical protein
MCVFIFSFCFEFVQFLYFTSKQSLRKDQPLTNINQSKDKRSNLVSTGGLLLLTQLEVLGALQAQLLLSFAILAFKTQDNFLCCLGLLVENRLSLTTETLLLVVVTSLTLQCRWYYEAFV